MATIKKHIGTHNSKQVVVIFRKVPNEDHMCLVVYPEILPRAYQNSVMAAVDSAEGQATVDIADVLSKSEVEGKNLLGSLHKEGFLKKIQTGQVTMTPAPGSTIRLDELNTLLDKIAAGGEAAQKLAEADKNSGLTAKKSNVATKPVVDQFKPKVAPQNGVLSDEDIANNNLGQAKQLRKNAEMLINEAARLEEEAKQFLPKTESSNVTETNQVA